MRLIFKPYIWVLMLATVFSASCKKDDGVQQPGSLIAKDYVYNLATGNFYPDTALSAQITSPGGIKFVYCYLLRSNAADSLIYVGYPQAGDEADYTFNISAASFPFSSIDHVRGVKVMVKQADNSSFEGFVKIDIYDPSKPFLTDFPLNISPDLNGGTTAVTGTVTSESGITKVDVYDDYQTEGTYVLVQSLTDPAGSKNYTLNYEYTYRKAAQHLKVAATDIYGQTMETVIDMPVDINTFKPKFVDFPASITPGLTGGTTSVNGRITSVTGLAKVDVYDDYDGSYVLINSITGLNNSRDYTFDYSYAYRKRAQNLKIIATDTDNLPTELVIPLNVTYQTEVYKDVIMSGQSGTAGSFFDISNATVFGNCEISGNEDKLDFLIYCSSAGVLSFYSPTNTSSAASSYKCNGTSWSPVTSDLKATRFRVLLPGTAVYDNIYALYNSGDIETLDDSFFTGISVPGSSSTKFDATVAPAANIFNLTAAYLIWVRIPQAGGTNKNCLLKVKEVNINTTTPGLSTIKFDIIVQK